MNRSELSAERARELFNYDPATGLLTWRVNKGSRAPAGSPAGSPHGKGYLRVMVDKRLYLVHRVAWLIATGSWPTEAIDHVNGVASDNRLCNLREATHAENAQNRRSPTPGSKAGTLGVYPKGRSFIARIQVSGAQRNLGTYPTREIAHRAYITAKRSLHGFCTI